ncbi:MAG TPA: class I SAM-dependent methyltransferase [Nitrososphaerales archaeon]|jgi:SAM-dependent methyltransferase|nr:class I SAM-dependent methyltransferase [Nitrososphaerales archaeon]
MPAIDQEKLNEFVGKFASDFGASLHASTVILGEKLGLYKAMAEEGKQISSQELASKTGTRERYLREWLAAQAAAGYAMYDADTNKYWLTPEQAFTLADENSPAYLPGAFFIASALFKDEPKITDAFRTGKGVGWHEHDGILFKGTEKFFRPGYVANLVPSWLPALDGVVAKLLRGARVADIGCGHGASTIIMAKAFPNSSFVGYDYHELSIQVARRAAEREGFESQIKFEVADAKSFPEENLDLVTIFDALHDMGDPAGAAKHIYRSLNPDGTWMIVEPMAGETTRDNLNPVGRIYYSASTMLCTPASISQEVGLALGAQAPESEIRKVIRSGGFTRFRRATQTPFNRVFEARP